MTIKSYKTPEDALMTVEEPAVAYSVSSPSVSAKWNPNVPFHATQEEWLEHIRSIEEGEFMTIEEADRKFELWRKEFLASRM